MFWKNKHKEKIHKRILNGIFLYPSDELGNILPKEAKIITRIKEPHLPKFNRKYKMGSLIDCIILYECNQINEICAIELKIGAYQYHHGMHQIKTAAEYFQCHWQDWVNYICSHGVCINFDFSFHFRGILLMEKYLQPIEKWVANRISMPLGKIITRGGD